MEITNKIWKQQRNFIKNTAKLVGILSFDCFTNMVIKNIPMIMGIDIWNKTDEIGIESVILLIYRLSE